MNTIEFFLKNRVLFENYDDGLYIGVTVFKPEDYNLDFLKEKNQTILIYI